MSAPRSPQKSPTPAVTEPTKFGDVFKATKDFFKKSFSDEHKVEVKSQAPNGVKYTAEGGVSKKGGTGSLKAEYKKGDFNVDKVQIGTDQKIGVDLSLKNFAPNTKALFKVEDGTRASGAKTSATFGLETVQNFGVQTGLEADFDVVNATANASTLFNYQGFLFGASGSLNTHINDNDSKGLEPTAYDVLVGYKANGSTFGLQTEKKFSSATAFFYNEANKDFTVTGKASFGLNASALKQVDLEFGGKYKWDDASTLYGSVNRKADIKFAHEQKISPKATLNLYAEVKAVDLASDQHKLGSKLSLSD
eukprot:gb/GECG01009367.1/.p1 GENE.gb/GECG01009367.1/~~gb/GECG01009367.1/.p1  ORF type:complete len:307 (+),score=57.39 gb/GECG01009367.1/:1-921(+)